MTATEKPAYLVAVLAGAGSWLYIAAVSGRREPWDDEIYFTAVMPALALVAGGLGALVPDKPWRWGLVPFGAQAAMAFIQNPTANLLPLGLIAFAIFGGICAIPAYLGAAVRRLILRNG